VTNAANSWDGKTLRKLAGAKMRLQKASTSQRNSLRLVDRLPIHFHSPVSYNDPQLPLALVAASEIQHAN